MREKEDQERTREGGGRERLRRGWHRNNQGARGLHQRMAGESGEGGKSKAGKVIESSILMRLHNIDGHIVLLK